MTPTAPASVERAPRRSRRRRSFRHGAALGTALRVWAANFLPFTLLALVVMAPSAAFQAWNPAEGHSNWLTALAVDSLSRAVLSATVVFGVFEQLRGRRPPMTRVVATGLARLLPTLGVAIALAMLFAVCLAPGYAVLTAGQEGLALPLVLAGLVGIAVLTTGCFVAVPACIVERLPPPTALARSWSLTRGHRLAVFVLLFALWIGSTLIASFLLIPVVAIAGAEEESRAVIAEVIAIPFVATLQAVLAAVVYHDLRVAKEGIDTDELAAVFD